MSGLFTNSRYRAALRVAAIVTGTLLASVGALQLVSTTSCAGAQPNNPLRSFEGAKNIDVVCMQTLASEDGGGIPPVPLAQAACTPVPTGTTGAELPNHLFALVTQVTRGEVAVVDLTAGVIVDEDLGTPGTNFLPVGEAPTGIASSPDGKMSYVVSAEVNKPAIYALPSTEILGNSQELEGGAAFGRGSARHPPLLTTWPVCALPQAPGSITIIPNAPSEPVGAEPSAVDAGATGAPNPAGYVLAVVLTASQTGDVARMVTYDPAPLIRGAGAAADQDAGAGDAADIPGATTLAPCKMLGEVPFSGALTDASAPGPTWLDGVKWIDGGIEAAVPEAGACKNATVEAGLLPPALPNPAPQPTAAARAGQYLYVADGALPLVHVFDLSSPASPREVEPLHATSLSQPSRAVTISTIAISPPTRDYRQFLYAVDATDSPPSIIVYEITDPIHSPHVPLRRPHSNLVPLQPEDRINFTAGVAALAFVQHDWPIAQTPGGGVTSGAALTGLLCNPNPNVDLGDKLDAAADVQTFSDPGAIYRNSSLAFSDEPLGPTRLRGIFAFATLTNGEVVTIDVDDWDAPCRRPEIMGRADAGRGVPPTTGFTSAIAPPEPLAPADQDAGPLDPYEAPYTYFTDGVSWVSDEAFFPVSEPHRPRSEFPLSSNSTYGLHYPYLLTAPQLYTAGPDGGLGATVSGSIESANPALLPTATSYPDPSPQTDGGVGIRLAFEDPTAHIDQTWTIDYEGRLPTFQNLDGNLQVGSTPGSLGLSATRPDYWTLFLSVPGGQFCSKGVEDWEVGQQRAAAYLAAEPSGSQYAQPQNLPGFVGDYVQFADPLLPPGDPYWSTANACWAGFTTTADGGAEPALTDPNDRYTTCAAIFGATGNDGSGSPARDFPIVQAFDDGFVLTRFYYPNDESVAPSTSNRFTAPPDKTNVSAMKQLQCCFHGQSTINVRTGGEWLTTGSASGYLHHITVDPITDRCVTSCNPEFALLNGRTIGIAPSGTVSKDDGGIITETGACSDDPATAPDRDSPLATRTPSFSFFIQHPCVPDPTVALGKTAGLVVERPPRDDTWQFSLKGELTPLSVNIAATNTSVSPQSMLFIPSLGQLAVIDGSQSGQGLVLIDLNTVTVTGNSYY